MTGCRIVAEILFVTKEQKDCSEKPEQRLNMVIKAKGPKKIHNL